MYWRLLSSDPEAARAVVLSDKPEVRTVPYSTVTYHPISHLISYYPLRLSFLPFFILRIIHSLSYLPFPFFYLLLLSLLSINFLHSFLLSYKHLFVLITIRSVTTPFS